ncbi:hypothetical protein CLU86_3706 [Acidovorax sp. 62]|nr:hypothetical protein CLU86_3706 [Acidovorax sp. 62]
MRYARRVTERIGVPVGDKRTSDTTSCESHASTHLRSLYG